jgi:hypothetical protein
VPVIGCVRSTAPFHTLLTSMSGAVARVHGGLEHTPPVAKHTDICVRPSLMSPSGADPLRSSVAAMAAVAMYI